ncbi:uncharacterized protein LOC124643991 isoform X2 [Helicoverpa zea]|uniref:uncharacterized protein LOC124632556 isoform X2 n=1 Tax=Helicoverpa zea TaxID=7113 RepID=UPI001F5AB7BA|nr:uncharacterized protein LOC124632556 isoform X2 [Helicoverpa zea]XP_047025371.1 uncharacterized protein LOC124634018 isoform X2 [Helicoverpa zea]XP_047031235.1 uncharacterized protein LOC124638336 isoform X2 [Helicoverpa zea]XP_047034892.1 uncharacterized protein LOC124640953 isoform X2 [Helicoverpa zea]XP_047038791.1 uncharacterized protein LOC124643761 isoform X2 [Helicoverpa zea]XP_047039099.1 uncharacterized protein LOC124643991 isoform X2 [Helicoverpa zea]XP_049691957.1 uncharacterize
MDSKLKELVKKRASCKAKLTLFSNYLNVVLSCSRLSDLQVTELETRLDKMDLLYNDYDKIQGDIELLMEDSAEALADREAFQNQYFSLVSSAREVRRQHSERRASVLQRTRWHASTGEIKLNQLVLIREKTQPPLHWLLGRIVKVFPGADGITRVAEIKTKKGNITRAFNNICPLPIEDDVSTRAGCSETSRT